MQQNIDIKKIARLAKIEIPSQDEDAIKKQLEDILDYIDTLSELNLDNIKPTAHAVEVNNVFREDVLETKPDMQDTIKQAPMSDGTFFKVPKVI